METKDAGYSKEDVPINTKSRRILVGAAVLLIIALLGLFALLLPLVFNLANDNHHILVIKVDDLDEASFDQLLAADLLPNIEQHIVNRGVRFTDSIVTDSACCPSRASFLTGQYAHNHGVNSTGGTNGGMAGFHPDGDMDRPTLALWLGEAASGSEGYFTGIIGKYMNHYTGSKDGEYPVPAGWDYWRVLNATGTHQLEPGKYEIVNNDGESSAPMVYQTRQLGNMAKQFLAGGEDDPLSWQGSGKESFFLYLTPTAPHAIGLPDDLTHHASCSEPHPQWLERVVPDSAVMNGYDQEAYQLPTVPSCNRQFPDGCLRTDGPGGFIPLAGFELPGVIQLGSEDAFLSTYDQGDFGQANESIRPAWIDYHWDPITCDDNLDHLRRQHLDRLESMLSVDVMVGEVIDELETLGVIDDTLIVFTSDNGFMLGEHRLGNKQVAYEESIRVPLIIRPPRSQISEGIVNENLVANIDLAPTVLDYAGRSWQSYDVDGRSLRPLIEAPGAVDWRDWLLVEHWHPDGEEHRLTTPDRWWRVPTHMALRGAESSPSWSGLTLVEYEDEMWGENDQQWIDFYGSSGYHGEFLYDLAADPYQVSNGIDLNSYVEKIPLLRDAIHSLSTCKGESCREADSAGQNG